MSQQSIKKNTVFNVIKTLSSIIFPLITFPYVSRVLLAENVGKINFGLSIVSYFSLLASLGIATYAIRECSAVREDKEKLSNTASQIYSINIISTVFAYIVLSLTLLFYRKLENYRLLIIIQSISIVATTLGADWLNSAMEDFRYITVRTIIFQFVSLVLMIIFVHQPSDYMKYVVICLISSAGANVMNIWYRRKYCNVRFVRNIKNDIDWNKHLMPIIYLFVMLLSQTIFYSIDSTMLGIMHGDREVGIYSAAQKISNILNQLIASLLWVIMPRMSYYFAEGNYDEINRLLRRILGFNSFLGLPCVVGTFMLSDEIILLISGNDFSDASVILKILMIGLLIKLFGENFLGNSILLPSKREKTYMIVCCVAAIVNVITNYIFIPLYGAIAAAGTTAFCALVIMGVLLFILDRKICIKRIPSLFITPLLGCAGVAIVCITCKSISSIWVRTFTSIGLSTIVYFIIAYLGKNDLLLELLGNIKAKRLRK